uniref:tetratricopeptide repeat protein n=1 Tax=Lacinutrix sp. TaxID=1937692 RepID=UPI0025C1C175
NYISGELSAEESLDFENRLDSDEAFAQSFRVFADATIFLQNSIRNEAETNAFKTNLKNISNGHFNTTETVATKPQKSKVFRVGKLAMAASVALFIGVFLFNQLSNPTYSDFNTHEPMTIVRGNVKDLIEATKAFNNKEYAKANTLLKTVLENDPENSELQLYYAITNIELDNFEVADTALNKIITGESAYKNRALWYSALSRLKQKNIEAAIVLLKQITEEADDYKEAQKLLDKLE